MKLEEKIDLIDEAQEKLFEVIELLEEAVGDDNCAKSYMIDQLRIRADREHGFLTNDMNMDTLKEKLEEDEKEKKEMEKEE